MNKFYDFLKTNKWVIITVLVFGAVYCLISLVNHYNFRTNAGDLGIYNQAIYDYAHFRFNFNTVWFGNRDSNILSDHLTIFQILVSPLYWIFKSYTLLVVQIVSILFGGLGIYKYIKLISKNEKLSLLALIHFFSIWGIYSALNFDYHDNVVAAMFVPWFLYYLKKERYLWSTFFILLLIISKENMIIWAAFIAIGMLLVNYKSFKKRLYLGGLAVFSLMLFYLAISIIIPSMATNHAGGGYIHFEFAILGANINEAIVTIISHPWDIFVAFFTNHLNNPSAVGVKNEFFLVLLLSGGVALLRKPQYLIVLLPVLGQKLFHDHYTHWALSAHYSIEFAPILTIALFEYFSERKTKHILKFALVAVVLCFTINIIKIEDRLPSWIDNVGLRFYASEHYKTPYNVSKINEALKLIPEKGKVSAESNLVPHLAERPVIYLYPRVRDAEYIALCPGDDIYYPHSKQEYEEAIQDLIDSDEWETIINSNDIILFKKRPGFSENKIKLVENEIKSDIEWFKHVKKQAKERNQTIEETLRKNAIFVLKNRKARQ